MWGTPQKKRAIARIGINVSPIIIICQLSIQKQSLIDMLNSISYKKLNKIAQNGGEGGIRTPDTREGTHAFQACALNHSATSPAAKQHCVGVSSALQVFCRFLLVT